MINKRIVRLAMGGAIVAYLLSLVWGGAVLADPGNAVLTAMVSDTAPNVGDVVVVTFTLTAMDAAEEFQDWAVKLGYDSSVLDLDSCSQNPAVWDSGASFGTTCNDNPNDVYLGDTNMTGNSTTNVPLMLGTAQFTVINPGDSNFVIITTTLADTLFWHDGMQTNWTPGMVEVQQLTAVSGATVGGVTEPLGLLASSWVWLTAAVAAAAFATLALKRRAA